MNFLAIDTSSAWIKIALQAQDEVITLTMKYKKRADLLMEEIDHLLRRVNITLDDLEGLGCIVGPGHFTGLRSGMATIKAISFAKSLKVSALTYPECVRVKEPAVLLRKARKGWWYFSEFDGKEWHYSLEPDEYLKSRALSDKEVICEEFVPPIKAKIVKTPIFSAVEMLQSLEEAFVEGRNVYDHASLKPFYVQRPVAEENLLKKRGKS